RHRLRDSRRGACLIIALVNRNLFGSMPFCPAENPCRPAQERIGFVHELLTTERAAVEKQVRLRQLAARVIFATGVADQARREDIDALRTFNVAGDWPQYVWAKAEVHVHRGVVRELASV